MMSKTANAQTQISSMRTLAERLLHKFKVEPSDEVVDEVEDLIEVIASTSLEPQIPFFPSPQHAYQNTGPDFSQLEPCRHSLAMSRINYFRWIGGG